MIANAVDLPGHPAITRRPARALQHDTDLGDRPVTTAVGPLDPAEVADALAAGAASAEAMRARGSSPPRRFSSPENAVSSALCRL